MRFGNVLSCFFTFYVAEGGGEVDGGWEEGESDASAIAPALLGKAGPLGTFLFVWLFFSGDEKPRVN